MSSNGSPGFSTLEILLAFTIIILSLSAVIALVFGSQSVTIDSQTSSEAIVKAGTILENARAAADEDFNLVNSTPAVSDGIYRESLNVKQQDFYTKNITGTVSWQAGGANREIGFSTLITNWQNALSGSTCNSSLPQNWTPAPPASYSLAVGDLLPASVPTADYPITGIDAYQGKLYVTVNGSAAKTNPTFFIFDISDQTQKPSYQGSVDNNATDKSGLNAVVLAKSAVDGKTYAYVANGYGADFSTCAQGGNCAQLQIIDVSNPASPQIVYNFKVPNVSGTQGVGNSIFYRGGYIYLGLAATGGKGPELNIIDVSNFPASPPVLVGSAVIGNAVNAVYVSDNYAYVASPNAKDILVFDVTPSNLSLNMQAVGNGFNGTNGLHGKSLAVVGGTIYLGRTFGTNEFYILDAQNPLAISEFPPASHADIGTGSQTSVNALVVRDYLAFLLTTGGQLRIFRVDNPTAINADYVPPISLPSGSSGTALDCEGDDIYAGSADSSSQGYLTIISGQ